jgi:F-type H+-transporting ATPase subunit a
LVGTWIVMGILIVFGLLARQALMAAADPTVLDEGITLRSVGEVIAKWLDGFVEGVLEIHGARRYVPFFGTLFMFILTANFPGLIPGMEAPTSDTDLTFALGIICFIYYIYQGFAHQGLYYLRSFLGPLWWLSWYRDAADVSLQGVGPATGAKCPGRANYYWLRSDRDSIIVARAPRPSPSI